MRAIQTRRDANNRTSSLTESTRNLHRIAWHSAIFRYCATVGFVFDGRRHPPPHRSGHEILDNQALDRLEKGKTAVAVPAALRGRAFSIDVPVMYNPDNPDS